MTKPKAKPAVIFDQTSIDVINFSLGGKVAGRINATALAVVRAERNAAKNGGIDAYNEMKADWPLPRPRRIGAL